MKMNQYMSLIESIFILRMRFKKKNLFDLLFVDMDFRKVFSMFFNYVNVTQITEILD